MLKVENLCKNFNGFQAVNNCSFKVKEGSITGLIGPNGAGKTTTFNMIAGEISPTSGQIIFEEENITGLPTYKMFHYGIVRTFQIPQEFAKMTVLENLMCVPENQPGEKLFNAWFRPSLVKEKEQKIRQRAIDALQFLRLKDKINILAGNLSGGQKKLLELGRVMMSNAKLVLLDEPAAGVNPSLVNEIIDIIKELKEKNGYTFILIEHNMEMINRLCDNVFVLAEGSILTQGSMDEISQNKQVLDAYLGG